ncbi:MAG TPA: gamma-glutamylcyclotransferase [Nitrospirae bacterium]|nr:gamma-glutamylcyclotransferase [Nitrospirota bacterium]
MAKDKEKHSLFVYGTLMWPEVLRAVIGRTCCQMQEAVLYGFKRCRVRGEIYPAIKKAPRSKVVGKLVRDLTEKELRLLDEYEGGEYERIQVRVNTASNREEDVFTYVIKDEYQHLLDDREWDERVISRDEMESLLHDKRDE